MCTQMHTHGTFSIKFQGKNIREDEKPVKVQGRRDKVTR